MSSLNNLCNTTNYHQNFSITGLVGSSLSYTLAKIFQKSTQPLLVFVPTEKQALSLREEVEFFLKDQEAILHFPPMGVLPYYGLSPSSEIVAQRMSFLYTLMHRKDPYMAFIPVSALLRRLPPPDIFNDYYDYLVIGEELDLDQFLIKLVKAGYQNVPLVEDPGTFCKRGGILDIFSPQMEQPVRLEFFGDQIESLRYFDPQTQRSADSIEELVVLPAGEIMLSEEHRRRASLKFRERANEVGLKKEEREIFLDALKNELTPPSIGTYLPLFYERTYSLFSYLNNNKLSLWLEPELCRQHVEEVWSEVKMAFEGCESTERVVLPENLLLNWDEIESRKQEKEAWEFRQIGHSTPSPQPSPLGGEGVTEKTSIQVQVQTHEALTAQLKQAVLGEAMLKPLLDAIQQWRSQGMKIEVVASSEGQFGRLEDLLKRHGILIKQGREDVFRHSRAGGNPEDHPLDSRLRGNDGTVFLSQGHLNSGFVWPEEGLVLLTDQEIFGKKRRRQKVGKRTAEAFSSFEELQAGDFIVHEDHGLGIYRGLQSLAVGEHKNDFLLLEYQGQDKLYLPVYRLNLVSRYSGHEGQAPSLDRLGGTSWEKQKTKVKKAMRAMAGELLKLYAQRATLPGLSFGDGGEFYEEFEATFPFEETPDQAKAIRDVYEDMSQDKPMDRLVCGDVGFGKTEVALRAAFRAVLDGKQVALLVPTTVLALQHERSFRQRFKKYPANIAALSRLVRSRVQQEVLKKIEKGEVDIVIGTHALLNRKIQFKKLGLLIVDEEHRFGVAQKEKIKQLKQKADVLTLTATPIPRTLNMSLSGIRDLSVITTPPVDRLAIQTLVANYNEALIREAIHRELARGGQVYFIHNRVQTIHKVHRRLQELLPEAKIRVGHGQMSERELEEVMIGFLNREFNVFLCTTIVESGLDVPSANTMIINRADTFGLAQLYQLRGRIGRSNLRAYAYLLIPGQEMITKEARARLSVLQRYTELGSGFKIASHDLEIRGAGNLLGAEQSGHIASVGYELYMQLMEEAMNEVKGQKMVAAPEPELQLQLNASIPESYLPDMRLRLSLYKRFASVADIEELESLLEETQDRFGNLPEEVKSLKTVMQVKLLAQKVWLTAVQIQTRQVVLTFAPDSLVDLDHLISLIQKEPERFRWLKPHELAMGFKAGKEGVAIESLIKFLSALKNKTEA